MFRNSLHFCVQVVFDGVVVRVIQLFSHFPLIYSCFQAPRQGEVNYGFTYITVISVLFTFIVYLQAFLDKKFQQFLPYFIRTAPPCCVTYVHLCLSRSELRSACFYSSLLLVPMKQSGVGFVFMSKYYTLIIAVFFPSREISPAARSLWLRAQFFDM